MNDKVLLLIVLAMLLAVLAYFHGSNIQPAAEQWITGVLGGILVLTRTQTSIEKSQTTKTQPEPSKIESLHID